VNTKFKVSVMTRQGNQT